MEDRQQLEQPGLGKKAHIVYELSNTSDSKSSSRISDEKYFIICMVKVVTDEAIRLKYFSIKAYDYQQETSCQLMQGIPTPSKGSAYQIAVFTLACCNAGLIIYDLWNVAPCIEWSNAPGYSHQI